MILLAIAMMISAYSNVLADQYVGVMNEKPGTRGAWHVNYRQYNFRGYSTGEKLYTSYQLTGKTSYEVYINNRKSNQLKVIVSGKTYIVASEGDRTINVSTNSATKKFYIKFFAPSNFDGYVK